MVSFIAEMKALGVACDGERHGSGYLSLNVKPGGELTLRGLDANIDNYYHPDNADQDADLVPVIQKHLMPDSAAIIEEIGTLDHENPDEYYARVHVITRRRYQVLRPHEAGKEAAARLVRETLAEFPHIMQLLPGARGKARSTRGRMNS